MNFNLADAISSMLKTKKYSVEIRTDEPTGNLDKQTKKEILDIFKKLAHEEGKCVIIVTHSQNVCDMVDEVYDLKKVK